ncbi:DUF7266 family protein [Halostagnicola bangensis]
MIAFRRDCRAVSIALTHALTLGITTILVGALLLGGGTFLEAETDRTVADSLETTGERLATEVTRADGLGSTDGATEEVTLSVEYPDTVANSRYRVGLVNDCHKIDVALSASEHCLELTATRIDESVYVPLGELDADVDTKGSVRGGAISVVHDGDQLGFENP